MVGRGTKQSKFHKVTLPGSGRFQTVKGGLKKGSAFKNSNASSKIGRSSDPSKDSVKAGGRVRNKGTVKRLELYRAKAPNKRDLHKQEAKPQRIEPDRRWFGNTRVIKQDKMAKFREELAKEIHDPYQVVLKSSKLPMSLLTDDSGKREKVDLLRAEKYAECFANGKTQKPRPSLQVTDLSELATSAEKGIEDYKEKQLSGCGDKQLKVNLESGYEFEEGEGDIVKGHDHEEVFLKGTSKRIWRELYKVVDSSDVIIHVLDARDPEGTRCRALEENIKKNHPHKHVVLLLNKCDLVPNWAAKKWCALLRKEKPCLAFHSSITNPFGKNSLISLLRQFAKLMCGPGGKQQLQVGFIGYPNVGKSSVVNTLKKKQVCKAAPIPGETKVWQYICLTRKIYAIDCPGIVPITKVDLENDSNKVLKGVVRAEKLENPSVYVDEVLRRVKKHYLVKKYNLYENGGKRYQKGEKLLEMAWENGEEFLTKLATKMGKLRKQGEPDLEIAARIVLYDWQRGRIPFFQEPPKDENDLEGSEEEQEKEKVEDIQLPNREVLEAEVRKEEKKETKKKKPFSKIQEKEAED